MFAVCLTGRFCHKPIKDKAVCAVYVVAFLGETAYNINTRLPGKRKDNP